MANTGKAGLKLKRGEGEKRAGGGKRRVSIFDGWKIPRKSIEIHFGHAKAIGDVINYIDDREMIGGRSIDVRSMFDRCSIDVR